MTRRSRNDNSSTTGKSFNHVDADTMILVVHIRKLFVLPYLAASGAIGIQLEQGWALIRLWFTEVEAQILHADSNLACPTLLTSQTSPHVHKSLRLPRMPNFAVATGNTAVRPKISPSRFAAIVARNAVSKTTQPTNLLNHIVVRGSGRIVGCILRHLLGGGGWAVALSRLRHESNT